MENNLVLFSGGLDSYVCLSMLSDKFNLLGVGFDYGQPHKVELTCARRIAKAIGIDYEVIKLPVMPKRNDIVFCGRNAVMLSMAFSMAQSRGIKFVTTGINKDDSTDFEDCRTDFIDAIRNVGKVYGITLLTPLIEKTKKDVVELAREHLLDLESSWTCYSPYEGKPCGKCYACTGRINAES